MRLATLLLALSLLGGRATAQLIPAICGGPLQSSTLCTFPPGSLLDQGEIVCDVKGYGAKGDGKQDDTSAIQLAITSCGIATGSAAGRGTIYFPPGRYIVSSSITLSRDCVIRGAGIEATNIQQIANAQCTASTTPYACCTGVGTGTCTTTGFPIFRNEAPRTCTGANAGSCDSRIGTNGRGAGCVCYTTADCVTAGGAVCSGGSARNFGRIENMKILPKLDNSVGIDFLGFNNWTIDHVYVNGPGTGASSHQNIIGMLFTDGGATVSGYSNLVIGSKIDSVDVGVRIMASANDQRIIANDIALCGSGLVLENGASTVHVTDTQFQTMASPTCGAPCGAGLCCGGYFHGKSCSVAADCGESDVIVLGNNATFLNPRIEDSVVPHVRIGENSTNPGGCPTCGAFTAQFNDFINHNDIGTGKPITEIVGKSQRNHFLMGATSDQTVALQRTPMDIRTIFGPYLDAGRQWWSWQSRDQASTTVDAIAMAAPAITGVASSVVDTTGHYVNYVSAGGAGNLAGWTAPAGTYNAVQYGERPGFSVCFKTDNAQTTSLRYWLGLFSAAPDASATPAVSYVAFRFDDATDTNGNWRACQDNGSGAPTCTDTGIAHAVNTRFCFSADAGTITAGAVQQPTYYINGAIVATASTKQPANGTTLHGVAEVVETNGTPKNIRLGKFLAVTPLVW